MCERSAYAVLSLQGPCCIVSVEGYCRGIAAGDVYVAWNVGDVSNGQSGYNVGDSHTGWVATVRIIVEEVDVDSADTVIV